MLRKARCRADASCMLLWRHVFNHAWRSETSCAVYIFADASPQWRGVEVFASSWDVRMNETLERRLLPIVYLPRDFLCATGKASALL